MPEVAKLVVELGVKVVTTGAGSPVGVPAHVARGWHQGHPRHCHHGAQARRMERLGVDAVVAEGTESGGHVGELTTMALVPSVREAVSIPVIAAGGIADGRGICAAFALGAEACRWVRVSLTIDECTVCDPWKEKVLESQGLRIVTGRGTGIPCAGSNKLRSPVANAQDGGEPIR